MNNYQPASKIRNISFIAHVDAGKTTLSEQILFHTGKTHCVGSIDEGTTVLDYLEEERKRGITIVSAAATVNWQGNFIHLIDTPGHIDFTAEVERSLRVIDGTVVIFSAVEGVEAQSEKVWYQADKYDIPRLVFINKLDRMGACFSDTVADINNKLGSALPIQIPVGIEDTFNGIIDLLTMQLYTCGDKSQTAAPIPTELMDEAMSARDEMLMAFSEFSETIAELYLNEQEIPLELLKKEIRSLTVNNTIIPVLCGCAKKDIGTELLLDAVIDYLPSPLERNYTALSRTGKPERLPCSADAPFCAFVFKLSVNENRELIYLRTYSGHLKNGDTLINSRNGEKIKIKHLMRLYANHQETIKECGPGDIIGLTGLKNTATGDTLCDDSHQTLFLDKISFPQPVLSMAIEPRHTGEKEKLLHTLNIICKEDPTLFFKENEDTGQYLISGMGELHLEITANRISNEFNLDIRKGAPKVAYKEMPRSPLTETYEFSRTAGDKQFWGKVTIQITPDESKLNPTVICDLPENLTLAPEIIEQAEESIKNSVFTGGLQGHPLIYTKVKLLNVELIKSYHPEESITPAVFYAFDQALRQSGTTIMEPLMHVEALCPPESAGEAINYLQSRKAEIKEVRPIKKMEKVTAEVPLDQMFGFGKAMPKLTAGRGSFNMTPSGYRACATSHTPVCT